MRYTSIAMYKAAADSDPWRGCSSGCQMQSSIADSMTATQRRFEAEARASLLKARALEAAHCPQWGDEIMNALPVTPAEKAEVAEEYTRRMDANMDELSDVWVWQMNHPQCLHTSAWVASGTGPDSTSPEDTSGFYEKKKGYCSVYGRNEFWPHGLADKNLSDPDVNPAIRQVACANALRKFGFGDGSYADPKACRAP